MNGQNSRNIMNNFLIFGDSYADEHTSSIFCDQTLEPNIMYDDEWQNTHSYRWPIKIKNHFEKTHVFENHALSGSSPYNALSKLMLYYDDIQENDIILFFLSDLKRVEFNAPSLSRGYSGIVIYDPITQKGDWTSDRRYTIKDNDKLNDFFSSNESEINFFYNNFFNILTLKTLQKLFIGFLKNLSNEKQCKVLVFSMDKMKSETGWLSDNFYFFNDLSNVSDYEYKFELSSDAIQEWRNKKETIEKLCVVDNRINHLSPINHDIMFATIKKIINKELDLPKFKKHFLTESVDILKGRYIYE